MICPICGESNPDRARFCLLCGAPLAHAGQGGEERKRVTVVFCDLVGFTARSDHADPEDVKATLRPFHARLKQEIEHFGGTLDKFIGDGVLGVFGAPVAHEDDPERAVRAALRIQEVMPEISEAHPGLNLTARAGVATGQAIVSFGEGPQIGESVTGDVVNTASRIQQVAPPGGVVVAESTYQVTRGAIDYEAVGPVSVKGKEEPLSLWRAASIRSRLGVGVDVLERHSTPFIGRSEDLFLVKATYRRAVNESSVQLVTVTGEPGVGKSRLLAELRSYIDELPEIVRWRQGRCLPYGDGITFWALSEIVKAQTGILESDQPQEAEAKLATALDGLSEDETEREWLKARLRLLAGLGDASAAAGPASPETFTAWRRFFEALAGEYPLVLVFEDLHWADPALLEFIDYLVEWAVGVPLLILCAARPELYERHPRWGGGKRNSTTIPLPPLGEADAGMLVSALVDRWRLAEDARTALVERSGGNPLYAEELAQMLADRAEAGDESLAAATAGGAPGTGMPVPEAVQGLVAARLDTLPAVRKALLHDAAVLGNVFWDGALATMSGLDPAVVRDELHAMARKEMVRPARTSTVAGQAEYSFWHSLIRDVAYGQIPRALRGRKHLAAARWLEEMAGARVADRSELLAYHYGQALELARASGEGDTGELAVTTGRLLVSAGDQALGLDVAKADGYYRRALDVLPSGHPDGVAALIRRAWAASMAGRFSEAERDAEEAATRAGRSGDRRTEGEALVALGSAVHKVGDTARAMSALVRAREILEEGPPSLELARVYNRLAGTCLVGGRFEECREWAERALALARDLGAQDESIRARQFRGTARCDLGDAAGLEDLWEALREGLELGLGEETALCYGNLAYELWLTEGPEIAKQVWSSSIEFCETRGLRTQAMLGRTGLLEVLSDLGRWDEALRIADQILAWERSSGGGEMGLYALSYRGMILAWRGDVEGERALAGDLLPLVEKVDRPEYAAPALSAAMLVELGLGHREAAMDLARRFGSVTEGQPAFRALYLPWAVEVLLGAGGVDEGAIDEAEALLPAEEELVSNRSRHALVAAGAAVAEARGRIEEAADLYADAAARWRQYGFTLGRARAMLGRGRCLAALGRTEEAEADLASGAALLDELGAVRTPASAAAAS